MKYDFTTETAPKGTNSIKWDRYPEMLPMWVAEMDFPAAPFIREALHKRIDKAVFGYTHIPDSYYDAVSGWFSRRHGWSISREQIIPISGIVPAISVAIRALTMEGPIEPGAGIRASSEKPTVIMQTPAYNCFFGNIRNMGCELSANVLGWNEAERHYEVDWEDFERRCAAPGRKVFLLCNPHNPTGRLWTRDELTRMGEICLKHDVPVISDEIHCEICAPGSHYIPFAGISKEFAQNCVSFVSPTKSFNIAGLQIANIVSANEEFRAKVDRVINDWEHCDVNQLGIIALQAAYSPEGEEWLAQMNEVVDANFSLLREALAAEFPQVRLPRHEATYLAWPDFSALKDRNGAPLTGSAVQKYLAEHEGLLFSDGAIYGNPNCCRINLACPTATAKDGIDRLLRGLRVLTA
ncbi:MAG: PatB family C-S lyase [Bacteroidales bacterium]|nr:PatB family C-S lyase [Bacteroidales bacterium]